MILSGRIVFVTLMRESLCQVVLRSLPSDNRSATLVKGVRPDRMKSYQDGNSIQKSGRLSDGKDLNTVVVKPRSSR